MAKALLELETLDAEQLSDIMAGKPPRPPKPSSSPAKPGDGAANDGTQAATAPAPTV